MPVKLRLMRMGKTKQPTYRLVAADSRSPRNGRFIELLGTYQPRKEPSELNINAEKTARWIANGAQPTERVQKILVAAGVLAGEAASKTMAAKKMAKRPAKQKTVKEVPAAEAPEAPAEAEAAASEEAGAES
jgi:small subunit ribosomal protein S16